jgi:hypothetical protein
VCAAAQGNDEAQQGAPLHWARLLYVGALAQAAVTLAAALCSGSALGPYLYIYNIYCGAQPIARGR